MATEVQKERPDFRVLDDLREARSCERLKNCCLMSCNELMQELMWDSVHQRTAEQTTDAVAATVSEMEIALEILRRIYDISREETDFRVRIELERIAHLLENEREREKTAWGDLERKYYRGFSRAGGETDSAETPYQNNADFSEKEKEKFQRVEHVGKVEDIHLEPSGDVETDFQSDIEEIDRILREAGSEYRVVKVDDLLGTDSPKCV